MDLPGASLFFRLHRELTNSPPLFECENLGNNLRPHQTIECKCAVETKLLRGLFPGILWFTVNNKVEKAKRPSWNIAPTQWIRGPSTLSKMK